MTVPPIPRHELVAAGETLVRRLSGRWQDSGGMCLCPAHADRSPSLSVRIGHSRLLFHCFAGCTGIEIIAAIRRMQPDALAEAHPMTSPPSAREVWLRARALDLWDESRDLEGSLAELSCGRDRSASCRTPFAIMPARRWAAGVRSPDAQR